MNSNSQTPIFGDVPATKPNGKDVVSSAEPVKRVGQAGVSLATAASGDSKSKKQNGKAVVSSADPAKCAGQPEDSLPTAISGDLKSKKPNDKVVVSSADPVKRARQHGVSLAIAVTDVPNSKKLNGKAVVSASDEILFFKDVKFGPQEGELRFRLIHFWEARNTLTKVLFGLEMLLIDEHGTVIQGFISPNRIETYLPHMFAGSVYWLNNFYGSKSKSVYRVAEPDVTIAFTWNCVLSVLENSPVPFPEDRGPVMKLCIWDKAAAVFCEKFKALGKPPTVINQIGHIAGALSLSSLSSSRVFFDMDVQATRECLAWYVFESNTEVANRVNAEIVTKAETATIGELLSYMKQEGAKLFSIFSDVICRSLGSSAHPLLMILCVTRRGIILLVVGARLKQPKGLPRLCVRSVERLRLSALRSKICIHTSELVESYFEANESVGDDHVVPVPPSLTDSIGQTRTFVIKVSKHNLDGKTQSLTVTKVLPLKVPALEGNIDEDVEEEPADEKDGAADGTVKRNSDGIESGETKRAKCG
ncbi:unnamed protein product [Brassica napus]|uniref:(rape) hypothetical protein n=1 Tax=Brassica napus TaxID=3708 RepID=A0A816IKT6_BRANA|nr:unnamed protein product [Brassica napus]